MEIFGTLTVALVTQVCAMLCYTKLLQSCPTLCDPRDGSPLGSSVTHVLKLIGLDFPGGAGDEYLSAKAGHMGLIPGLGRSRMPQGNVPMHHGRRACAPQRERPPR